jgi:uncharacterized protein
MALLTQTLQYISTLATIFLGIFIEALPYLLLGIFASGFIEVFVNKELILRLIPNNRLLAVFVGSLLGLIFPVCEHGVVPLTRRLFQKGMPVSMGITFMLAAPVMNPIVIASTLAAFGLGPVFWARILLTLFIAIITGLIFSTQKNEDVLVNIPENLVYHCAHCGSEVNPKATLKEKVLQSLVIAGDEFFEIGLYFIIGAFLAATLQTFVPQEILLAIGGGPVLSIIVMISLAVVLSICSTVDAFVALAFASKFSTGSILAFLVYGPMIDIKALMMFTRVFKKKTILYLALIPLFLVILASLFMTYYLAL